MGLLESIAGSMISKISGVQGEMVEAAFALLKQYGGLNGVLERFHTTGYSAEVDSWISTADSLPISPEQVEHALGTEAIAAMAEKFELSAQEVKNKLAKYLPYAVDRLTPDGVVPSSDSAVLLNALALLKK